VKALFHQSCGSIRSPKADGSWTLCDCGQSAIRWTDPGAGTARVWARDPVSAAVIGFNNTMLISEPLDIDDERWRHRHTLSCTLVPENYLFSVARRDCWAVIFRPGDTGDVTWHIEEPEHP
jgi:hypothetical protein